MLQNVRNFRQVVNMEDKDFLLFLAGTFTGAAVTGFLTGRYLLAAIAGPVATYTYFLATEDYGRKP